MKFILGLTWMALLSSLMLSPVVVEAHSGDHIESSWVSTPPTINGVLSSGEWAGTTMYTLTFYNVSDGTVFLTLTLYVMNDYFNLYMAAVYPDGTHDVDDAILFLFDPQHDGVSTNNDEDGIHIGLIQALSALGYTPSPGAGDFFDGYYDTSNPISALLPFGNDPQQNGKGFRSHNGTHWTLETCKPLRSGDPHDMYVEPDQTMGLGIFIMDVVEWATDIEAGVWPEEGLAIFPSGEDPNWEIAASVAADLHLASLPRAVGGVILPASKKPLMMPLITVTIMASSLIVVRRLKATSKR